MQAISFFCGLEPQEKGEEENKINITDIAEKKWSKITVDVMAVLMLIVMVFLFVWYR